MTNALITQSGLDALTSDTSSKPRVTQSGLDVSTKATGSKPRISQSGIDVSAKASGSKPRVTQVGLDVLVSFLLAPFVSLVGMCSREIEIHATATAPLLFSYYRSNSELGAYSFIGSNDSGIFTDTVPLKFTDYWYRVSVTYAAGLGPLSSPVSAQAKDVLDQMTPFLACVPGDDQVTLTWAAFTGATAYSVYRDTVLLTDGITDLFYVDSDVQDGTQYNYQLAATNECGDGSLSDVVTAIPQCCAFEYGQSVVDCGGYMASNGPSNSFTRKGCH